MVEELTRNGAGEIGSWVNLHVDVLSVKRYFFQSMFELYFSKIVYAT